MFEKEAEEYAIDNYENCLYDNFSYTNDLRAREQSFKDGAEFVYNEQLTKAKEIIKDYMTIAKGIHSTVCGVPEENHTINVLQLNEEAEQFIREAEK